MTEKETVSISSGTTGVFLPIDGSDPEGFLAFGMAAAVARIRDFESISRLSGPKFRAAMEDDEVCRDLRLAIASYCRRVRKVGIITLDSE